MGPSSSSLLNIVVRVQAQRALSTLNALRINLEQIETVGTQAGLVLDGISDAARGWTRTLGSASVEAANLAKALSQMNRPAATLPGRMLSLGVATESAAKGMGAMAVQARALSAVMGPLAAQTTVFANAFRTISRASAEAALAQTRADAVRQQSAVKTAEAVRLSALREQTARTNAAAHAQAAASRVAAAQAREQAANAAASAAVIRAEEAKQAARYKTAAAAATASAQIAAAEARQAAAAQAAAAAAARGSAAAGAAGAIGVGAGAVGAGTTAMGRFRDAVVGADSSLARMGSNMQKQGSRVQWMGRQLSANLTAPLALLGVGATAMYIQQEKAFTMLAKVYDGADEDLGDFGGKIGKVTEGLNMMSNYFGVNREEVYATAEAYASLGFSGGQLAAATQTVMEASILGNMSLEDSTEAMIAIQSQFQLSTTETKNALAEMNAIANQGPAELDDLVTAMARVGSIAREAGLSVAETAGFIETLTPAVGTAATAGNGLKSILTSILAPTAKANDLMEYLGINIERWRDEATPAVERLKEMGEKFNQLTDPGKIQMVNAIGGKYQIARLAEMLSTINAETGQFAQALAAVDEEGGPASKQMQVYEAELKRMLDSDYIGFARAWQMIKNSMVDAIKPAIPAILQLVQLVARLFKWFGDLSPQTRQWIFIIAGAVAVLGPVIIMMSTLVLLLGLAASAFARVIPVVAGFGKVLLWALSGGKLFQVNAITAGLAKLSGAFGKASGAISTIWGKMWVTQGRVAAGGAAANSGIIQRGLAWIATQYVAFTTGMTTMWTAFTARLSAIWAVMWVSQGRVTAGGAAANSGLIQVFFARLATMYVAFTATAGRLWGALWMSKARASATGAAVNSGIIQRFFLAIGGGFKAAGLAIAGLWLATWQRITAISIAGAAASGKAAVLTLVRTFIAPVVSAIGTAVVAVAAFVGLPVWAVVAIGAALVAAGVAVYKWRDQIGDAIKGVAGWFARLPGAIADILREGLRVIKAFAVAARDWLGRALNPWKRHSPSLVDNVRSGTEAIKDAYRDMADDVIASMRRATTATASLSAASRGIVVRAEEGQYQDTRANVARHSPAAAAEMDSMRVAQADLQRQVERVTAAITAQERVIADWQRRIAAADLHLESLNDELDRLQDAADATGKALSEAQDRLDEYTDAQISGQGAMSDAIFDNEMAQKRLRLEIMRLEDAAGPIEDIQDKYQALQGDIDQLRGKRDELRAKGAGSDILETYDRMIADLERQQGALAGRDVSELEKAQKALEELQRKGEKLDLENALKFDPLTRQIEKASSSMKEMPFDQIISGIRRERAEVERLTALQAQQNAGIEAQNTAIKAATAARDQMSRSLEQEQSQLEMLNTLQSGLSDQLAEVTDAMDATVAAAEWLTRKEEELAAALKAQQEEAGGATDKMAELAEQYGNMFSDEEGGGLLPPMEEIGIDEWMADFEKQMNDAFGELSLNPFAGLTWQKTITWLASALLGGDIGKEIEKLFIEGSGGVNWTKVLFGRDSMGDLWREIVVGLSTALLGKDIGSEMEKMFIDGSGGVNWTKVLFGRESMGDLWRDIVVGLSNALLGKSIGAEIEKIFIDGSGGPDWGKILIGDFDFGSIGRNILEGMRNGFMQISGGSFFDWITDQLPIVRDIKKYLGIESPSTVFADIGRNILEGLYNGLTGAVETALGWFRDLPGRIFEAIGDLGGWISRKFSEAIDWCRTNLPEYGERIWSWFREMPGAVFGAIGDLGGWISRKFSEAIDWCRTNLPGYGERIWSWFREVPGAVFGAIGDLGGWISRKFSEAFDWLRTNLPEYGERILSWFRDLPGTVVTAMGNAKDWLLQFGKDLVQGLMDGIGSMGSLLVDWVKGFFKRNVTDKVQEVFSIGSPSKLFAQFGVWNAEGLIIGMDSMQEQVRHSAQELANQVAGVHMPALAGSAAVAAPMPSLTVTTPSADNLGILPTEASAMPDQMADTVSRVESVLAQHGLVQQGQLSAQAKQIWNNYQTVKTATLAQFAEMSDGQLRISADRDGLLIAGQASFNGQTIGASVALKDGVVAVNTQLSNDVTTITAGLQANVSTLFGQMGSNVNKTAFDTANYQNQVWSSTRDNLNNLSANANQLVSGNFNNMANNLAGTYNRGILPVFNAFGPMLSTTQGWFQSTVDNIGAIWGGIQSRTADPARFVVNQVYDRGIKTAWNKVNGWLGLPPLEDYVAPFEKGGLVDRTGLVNPNSPRDIRTGGPLNGPRHGDRTLFAGKGGEYVLTQKMAADVGYDRLEAWRRAANAGKSVEGAASTFRDPVRALATGGEVRPGVIDEVFRQLQPWKGRTYQYGGGGDPGYDCSGWTGAVHKILLGQSPKGRIWTTEVDFARFGYKRGRDGYWSMGVHNGGGGMNSHTAGTLDGINFEAGGAHNTSTWGGPAAGTVHPQFEHQYVLPHLGGVFHGTAGGGSGPSMSQRVEQAYEQVMAPIRSATPRPAQGSLSAVPWNGLGKFDIETKRTLMDKAGAWDAENASMGNIAYDLTAGVEQWRGVVHRALDMVGQSRALDEITLRRMQQESGGNPNAINNWDINARNGVPSKGLMQVIDPTFQAHKFPGHDNIWAPLDNILASMRYALSRYGSLPAAYGRPGGYDAGGWLMPGFQATFNGTAKPEPILTAAQWEDIKLVARGAASLVRNIGKAVRWGVGAIFGPNPITDWIRDFLDRFKPTPPTPTPPPVVEVPPIEVPPVPPLPPFWSDAEQQKATWTADLTPAIDGLEGVVANLPRKVDEVVVPEWPPVPTIAESAILSTAAAAASAATVSATAATDANVRNIVDQYGAAVLGVEATVTAAARSAEMNLAAQENVIRASATSSHGSVRAEATVAPGGDTVTININGDLSFPGLTAEADVSVFLGQLKSAAGR